MTRIQPVEGLAQIGGVDLAIEAATEDEQIKKAIFKELGYARAVWASLIIIPRLLRAIGEAWRTSKRWPWEAPADHFHRQLADLRRDYGIRLI